MDLEVLFSAAGALAMAGWLLLLASPLMPVWSDRIAGYVIPAVLAAVYIGIVLRFPGGDGGYGSFAEVSALFSHPPALLAGWVHFLGFDLFIGAWICRCGRAVAIPFWIVVFCLPVTFLFGPAGLLLFLCVLGAARLRLFRHKT